MVDIVHELLAEDEDWPAPRLYALSVYSAFFFPELWRMIALGKRRRMRWVEMREPDSDVAYIEWEGAITTHADIARAVEAYSPPDAHERVVQVDPVKELWTMLKSRRTYLILPQPRPRL